MLSLFYVLQTQNYRVLFILYSSNKKKWLPMPFSWFISKSASRNKQRRVSVAQETEIVPVHNHKFYASHLYESRNQQKQCTLRLVEVCNHALHYFVFVSGSDNNLRTCMECVKIMAVHIIQYTLQWLYGTECNIRFIGLPLFYVQFFLTGIRILADSYSYII